MWVGRNRNAIRSRCFDGSVVRMRKPRADDEEEFAHAIQLTTAEPESDSRAPAFCFC